MSFSFSPSPFFLLPSLADLPSFISSDLFHWLFVPIVQSRLNKFKKYWNHHPVRKQRMKIMPSGHRPEVVYGDPARHGYDNWMVPVSPSAVQSLRNTLPPAPRFITVEFEAMVNSIWRRFGSPLIRESNAWAMFSRMRTEMRDIYEL